jgi:hypothetical protein
MEMFEASTGGQGCVAKVKRMIPHVEVQSVESSHVDIPFQRETTEAIVAFFRKVAAGHEVSDEARAAGMTAFDETKFIMEKARKSFKDTFAKAHPDERFPLEGGALAAAAAAGVTLEGMLAELNLEGFAEKFADEGYDDLETLTFMSRDELTESLEEMEMPADDIARVADRVAELGEK